MLRGLRWGRAMALFLAVWVCCFVYFLVATVGRSGVAEAELKTKVEASQYEIDRLERANGELRHLLKDVEAKLNNAAAKTVDGAKQPAKSDLSMAFSKLLDGPSKEYEVTRRQTRRDIDELWWFLRDQLETLLGRKSLDQSLEKELRDMLDAVGHRHKSLLSDLSSLQDNDGHDSWRKQEAKDLSDLVQARLSHLQNPSDCQAAKKLVCNLNKGCGYGCQIHHAIYCFIVAYGTERMMVLQSKGWRYDKNGFENVFLPLSDKCPEVDINKRSSWPGSKDTLVVDLPIVDSVNPRPEFLPPSIPKDLSDRIIRLHGDPVVWWISQFLKYMLRPQSDLQRLLKATETSYELQHPIVGIHVRRTDKVGTEAAFHDVDEYMKYVEEFYQQLEVKEGRKIETRRVFVASDDSKVLSECRKKYPNYVFLGDPAVAKSAAVSTRYSTNSLRGVITDIHMLAQTDYIVCTFSSQVCRIAYEIMQQLHPDAADRFKSLDDIFYFGGGDEHQQVAFMEHQPRNSHEIEISVGDVIGVAGNHWNGFNKGRNHRTNRVGLYPSYKTKENLRIVDFPTYPEVKL